MKIHYKKDRESSDKIIADVIYIGVIDGSEPVSVVLKDNRELTIRLDRIEAIVDDSIFQKESDTFCPLKLVEDKEVE